MRLGTPQVVMLSPSRELANQVAEQLRALSRDMDIGIMEIYGGVDFERQVLSPFAFILSCSLAILFPSILSYQFTPYSSPRFLFLALNNFHIKIVEGPENKAGGYLGGYPRPSAEFLAQIHY